MQQNLKHSETEKQLIHEHQIVLNQSEINEITCQHIFILNTDNNSVLLIIAK